MEIVCVSDDDGHKKGFSSWPPGENSCLQVCVLQAVWILVDVPGVTQGYTNHKGCKSVIASLATCFHPWTWEGPFHVINSLYLTHLRSVLRQVCSYLGYSDNGGIGLILVYQTFHPTAPSWLHGYTSRCLPYYFVSMVSIYFSFWYLYWIHTWN